MIDDSANLRALAWRLLATEGADGGGVPETADAAGKVCHKLHERLAVIIGRGGFSAILEHALKLTRAEFPFLPADLAAQDSPSSEGSAGERAVPGTVSGTKRPNDVGGQLARLARQSPWPGFVVYILACGLARHPDGLMAFPPAALTPP